ncbi:hypothetical protein D3C87_1766270 [compost metagenome]
MPKATRWAYMPASLNIITSMASLEAAARSSFLAYSWVSPFSLRLTRSTLMLGYLVSKALITLLQFCWASLPKAWNLMVTCLLPSVAAALPLFSALVPQPASNPAANAPHSNPAVNLRFCM